jgi:hypothetical protein
VNYKFTIPLLPEATQYQPTKLIELASTQLNIKISLPTVDKVLEAIKQGNEDKVTPLEWVYCIHIREFSQTQVQRLPRPPQQINWM